MYLDADTFTFTWGVYIYIAPVLKFAISFSSVVSVMFCSDHITPLALELNAQWELQKIGI